MYAIRRMMRKSERGQSFMELAVSIVFLLILLTAVIDLGWAFYTMIALRDTAQEAAAYGTMCPDAYLVKMRLRASATAPLKIEDIDPNNITVTFVNPDTSAETTDFGKEEDIVRISVFVNHKIVTPLIGTFIGTYEYPLKVNIADTVMVDLPVNPKQDDPCPWKYHP